MGNGRGSSHDVGAFEMPKPTYAFGPMGPFDPDDGRSGPSRAEIEDRPLVEAAMRIEDPWAEPRPAAASSTSRDSAR